MTARHSKLWRINKWGLRCTIWLGYISICLGAVGVATSLLRSDWWFALLLIGGNVCVVAIIMMMKEMQKHYEK